MSVINSTFTPEGVTKIERTQQWYEYRGVRFYTIEIPITRIENDVLWQRSEGEKTKNQWGYICIPHWMSPWNEDTSMKEIKDSLGGVEDGWFEHIRKEVSHFRDAPYREDWQKPSWYILAGWDYQHSWNTHDEYEINIVYECMKQIDLLFDNKILTSPQ